MSVAGLHKWVRRTRAEPLSCSRCGCYYASPSGRRPCLGTVAAREKALGLR